MMQNQNESLNGMVWQRVPKEVYVERDTLEFGLQGAVVHFNITSATAVNLFQALGINPGKYTEEGCQVQYRMCAQLTAQKSTKCPGEKEYHQSPQKQKKMVGKTSKRLKICSWAILGSFIYTNCLTALKKFGQKTFVGPSPEGNLLIYGYHGNSMSHQVQKKNLSRHAYSFCKIFVYVAPY